MPDHDTILKNFLKNGDKDSKSEVDKELMRAAASFDDPMADFGVIKKKLIKAIEVEKTRVTSKRRKKQLQKLAQDLIEAEKQRVTIPLLIERPN